MNGLRLGPAVLAALLAAAHFYRHGHPGPAVACGLLPLLLLSRRRAVLLSGQLLLFAGALLWVNLAAELILRRAAAGRPWLLGALILGAAAGLNFLALGLLRSEPLQKRCSQAVSAAGASTAAFAVTAGLLVPVHLVVRLPLPLLLAERLWPPIGGWVEILILCCYAAWLAEQLLGPKQTGRWRHRVWLLFSLVFFGQLALGLAGLDQLLMTGELHLPVPAVIVAGPLYRGAGLFMPILFAATVLLVGPAWCSHLCYLGAWDSAASRARRRPLPLPAWAPQIRLLILAGVVAVALLLGHLGASSLAAAVLGLAFGLAGVALMLIWSRRTGAMAHCVVYCPIGLLADVLGKLSPFRIRIDRACDGCGGCTNICRYDALSAADIRRRRPALSCSLCGDCLGACPGGRITYRFAGLSPPRARTLFIVLAAALHAAFLGLARI